MVEEIRRYSVGAYKIPSADRDVANSVMYNPESVEACGYRNIMGSDTPDDDDRFPEGSPVAYTLELTEAQAEAFAAASNARYVEEESFSSAHRAVGRYTGAPGIPSLSNLAFLGARYVDLRRWHGRDVKIAVLDDGTTQALRDAMGWTLVARTITSGVTMPPGRETFGVDHVHGVLVASDAVPPGGLLLDAVICAETPKVATKAAIAAGITWAVDQGAAVINCSYGDPAVIGGEAENKSQVILDAVVYAQNAGVVIVCSAGNGNTADLAYPSSICRTRNNVFSAIAFDSATDRRALFSNYHADGSGCAPGVLVMGMNQFGVTPWFWDGTSAAAPLMTQMIARGATNGTFTAMQVAAALKANARDTGAGSSQQGAGAWDLQRALTALSAAPGVSTTPGVSAPVHIDTRGAAVGGGTGSYTLSKPTNSLTEDVRVSILFTAHDAGLVVPDEWFVLADVQYTAVYERDVNNIQELPHDVPSLQPNPLRMRVLAHVVTDDEPDPTSLIFGNGTWFSVVGTMTFRCPGGFDPEKFVPRVKFGTGGSLDTVSVLPVNNNDILVCAFAQRHPTSTTGTLSVPAGLTQQGFFRPTSGTTGYILLLTTASLASGSRTPSYVSTSNDSTGTWATVAFTVPAGAQAIDAVVQSEPAFPAQAFMPFFQGA